MTYSFIQKVPNIKKAQEEFSDGTTYITFDDDIPMQSTDGITEETEIMNPQDQNGQRKEEGVTDNEMEGQSGEEVISSSPTIKSEHGVVKRANPITGGNIVRVAASGQRIVTQFRKRRRFTVNDVIDSINQNHFTGYELLQIVKAAVPKL